MRCWDARRRNVQAALAAMLLLAVAVESRAADSYNPTNGQLTIPSVGIGSATYSNVVVRIAGIVSAPAGSAPIGSQDSYNPATRQLTAPAVIVGSSVYYNAAATVATLVSIGGVSGADSYDGVHLSIGSVQAGSTIYTNVVITVAGIIGVAGGMPTLARDAYDPTTSELLIPAAVYRGKVYTNITVTVGTVVSIGGSGGPGGAVPLYIVTTMAGSGANGSADGNGAAASFWNPQGVAVDSHGNVFVADSFNYLIREIAPAGIVTTIAGQGIGCFTFSPGWCDGAGPGANFYYPGDIAVDRYQELYVADTNASLIRAISPALFVSTLAGIGQGGSQDGPGLTASFFDPQALAVDGAGNVYVADTFNSVVRRIATDAQSTVSTLPGSYAFPNGIATDYLGNVYVADTGNNRIRKITPAGSVTTLAGVGPGGSNCASVDGAANSATFCVPWGVAVDCIGNVYVTDEATDLVRVISPSGNVATIAGIPFVQGANNGLGLAATFQSPQGIAVDYFFNLYVADSSNNLIRKLTPVSAGPSCSTILRTITILPADPIVAPGRSLQLSAIGTYADGSSRDITALVTWKSATAAVATISPAGLVTATATGGTALISAAHGSVTPGSTTVTAAYTVGGTVNGLLGGSSIVLQNNGGDTLTVRNNGPFTFATPLANGAAYSLGIKAQPANQPCSSLYGAAKINGLPVTNIDVFCGPSAPNGGFFAAGTPLVGRQGPTATLLLNGQVLVTGGNGGVSSLAGSELYDPGSDSWSAAATMSTGRTCHTATLLDDGRVLVVGGTAADTAELYDPAANTWTSAASTALSHACHTATRLIDGRVLIVGGNFGASAELYDPAANAWASAGTVGTSLLSLIGHTAVLLPDGRVLVAGGEDVLTSRGRLAAAMLYDPAANAWTAAASMSTGRALHSMNLLPDGSVLVSGGGELNLSLGGSSLASAERYDPAANTWSAAGSMASARESHTGTLLPTGQVLVAGGVSIVGGVLSATLGSAELYDPVSNHWTATGGLGAARYDHRATLLLNGEPLVVDGFFAPASGAGHVVDSAEFYW